MAAHKKTPVKRKKSEPVERDSVYMLKLILFFILGCLWLQIGGENGVPVPVGLLFGIFLAMHEHFQIDRKIEYAILLVAAILSFIAPIGFVLNLG